MPDRETKRPYILLEKTSNVIDEKTKDTKEVKHVTRVYLDYCWSTQEHIMRLLTKPGNRAIGHANIIQAEGTTSEAVQDELLKIAKLVDLSKAGSDPKIVDEAVTAATAPLLEKLAKFEEKAAKKKGKDSEEPTSLEA